MSLTVAFPKEENIDKTNPAENAYIAISKGGSVEIFPLNARVMVRIEYLILMLTVHSGILPLQYIFP